MTATHRCAGYPAGSCPVNIPTSRPLCHYCKKSKRLSSFEDRVRSLIAPDASGCWIWLGSRKSRVKGRDYGQLGSRPATKVVWEMVRGEPFPEGMFACHHCDNPPCVNPDHIFPGTARDNARDAYNKGRLVMPNTTTPHCRKGHPWTPENTYVYPNGSRKCRICRDAYQAALRAGAA